ncbi:MAG: serine hydrolase [Pseudomonadota bacterium]
MHGVSSTATAWMLSTSIAIAGGAEMEAKLKAAFAAGALEGLHSVLVLKDGEIFAEAHFAGEDESWGVSHGVRQHGPDTLHDLRSVTKSLVSLMYGIALAEGKVPPVDASLVAQFPEYPDLAADPARQKITIEDALTMRTGLNWDETNGYVDQRNSEVAMEYAPDRFRFALEQEIVGPPGEVWNYTGGATTLIERLITKGTGQRFDLYMAEKLFKPLGITDWGWLGRTPEEPAAASGLRLNIHDLARIGQMILDGGKAGGVQVVPKDWLAVSMAPHTSTGELNYGYFWWMPPGDGAPPWVAAFGNGGQRMSVNPALKLVFVIFAGNYNQGDAWKIPVKVSVEFLSPALQAE